MTTYQKLATIIILNTANKAVKQGNINEANMIITESEKLHNYFEKKLDFNNNVCYNR